MSDKTKIKKRYKDYPPNVPKRLFNILKQHNFNRSLCADTLKINPGYLSKLLNDGIEPPDTTMKGRAARKALFLHVHKEPRKKKKQQVTEQQPYYMNVWKHLSKEERHKTIKQYVDWKEKRS